MITLLCALSSNRDFPVFFTHKQKKSSPCSLSGSWSPFSLMCLPPSLWSSTSLRSVFVTFIIMESYNPTAGDTQGRSILMRRVGVPRGDVCDGSFLRGDTENLRREWRTGRKMGTLPPDFIPLVLCKKKPERPRRDSMNVDPALFSLAVGRKILFPGKASRIWHPQGQSDKQVEVMHFLCIVYRQRMLKTPMRLLVSFSHIQ